MSDDETVVLGRRIDMLTAEVRDLVRWLKDDQSQRLKAIEEVLLFDRRTLADHDKRISQHSIDIHNHGQRLSALETRSKRKARK